MKKIFAIALLLSVGLLQSKDQLPSRFPTVGSDVSDAQLLRAIQTLQIPDFSGDSIFKIVVSYEDNTKNGDRFAELQEAIVVARRATAARMAARNGIDTEEEYNDNGLQSKSMPQIGDPSSAVSQLLRQQSQKTYNTIMSTESKRKPFFCPVLNNKDTSSEPQKDPVLAAILNNFRPDSTMLVNQEKESVVAYQVQGVLNGSEESVICYYDQKGKLVFQQDPEDGDFEPVFH